MISWQKILDLINKTDDNFIILDISGNPKQVILSFEKYQKLILNKPEITGLTENELLEKINRDIATWKASQEQSELENWQPITQLKSVEKTGLIEPKPQDFSLNKANNSAKTDDDEDEYYFEPID
ncbi:MAG TPA: hypothetical protein VJG65_01960 [Patescibacteria group bacterium]|nr:hypothetical protein [Patescibacteria group bacterium]